MALGSTLASLLILSFFYFVNATSYRDILLMGQSIRISDTLVSKGGNYELGFFTRNSENSTEYYVGIRFTKVPNDKIVWVSTIYSDQFVTSSAFLTIQDGNIVVIDGNYTYQVTLIQNNNSTGIYATLLDTGNLVLLNNSNGATLWQSFDYPTDTLLPGMKIGNDGPGNTWSLTSGNTLQFNDTYDGPYTLQFVDTGNTRSLSLSSKSSVLLFDTNQFGLQDSYKGYCTLPIDSNSRLILEVSGDLKYEAWSEESKSWVVLQTSKCATDNPPCGKFSICIPQALEPCQCLNGFEPSDAYSWAQGDMSEGCVRINDLSCSKDRFLYMLVESPPPHMNLVDVAPAAECNYACLTNCSCVAYAYDIVGGTCMLWNDRVPTLKNSSIDINGHNIKTKFYLKLAGSDRHITRNGKRNLLVIVILISFLLFLLLLGLFVYRTRKQRRNGDDLLNFEVGMSMKVNKDSDVADKGTKVKKNEVKLPLFSFVSVSAATNNFSDTNKLGEGGFGPVYKGILLNGGEVAVKRLSRRSGQGWEELRNEALLIAKLQHNNLVRLLGCCIDRDEKMLIYEFMPNKSLDCFLFDAVKRRMLDWETRVRIIEGIAQGLLYLHQYSRFRIIHRDLKASNILLDTNMNPKISDFGMARIFGENELHANTNRIVGTYGYMSPEYAMEGLFSVKSDVFSFGVLLLEIISGKKNTGFYQTSSFNLLGYAWDLWNNDSGMELIDSELDDISNKHLVPRYVNIGLLCVQQSPDDRPTMSEVVSMFGNDTASLPCPKPPAFQNVRGIEYTRLPKRIEENISVNGITDSLIVAR